MPQIVSCHKKICHSCHYSSKATKSILNASNLPQIKGNTWNNKWEKSNPKILGLENAKILPKNYEREIINNDI